MPTLYKIHCHTDEKHRPHHSLSVLGVGTIEELLAKQDRDVAAWQKMDLETDNDEARDNAEEDGQPVPTPKTVWADLYRWEMERKTDDKWRIFAGFDPEGGCWSCSYQVS